MRQENKKKSITSFLNTQQTFALHIPTFRYYIYAQTAECNNVWKLSFAQNDKYNMKLKAWQKYS